jgi:hypothetical protein
MSVEQGESKECTLSILGGCILDGRVVNTAKELDSKIAIARPKIEILKELQSKFPDRRGFKELRKLVTASACGNCPLRSVCK